MLVGAPAIACYTGMTERQVRYRASLAAERPGDPRTWPVRHDGCTYFALKSALDRFATTGNQRAPAERIGAEVAA